MKHRTIYLIFFLSFFLASCFKQWSPKERKDFELNCAATDTFPGLVIEFRGFVNNDFDSIRVKEYKDTTLLDSFRVFVPRANSADELLKQRSTNIGRKMNIKYKYLFIVPGQNPYELDNMKMIMWHQNTERSEGWGCVMGDYTIDGKRFEHNANPTFIKRESGGHIN
jgi:hypothetical protein